MRLLKYICIFVLLLTGCKPDTKTHLTQESLSKEVDDELVTKAFSDLVKKDDIENKEDITGIWYSYEGGDYNRLEFNDKEVTIINSGDDKKTIDKVKRKSYTYDQDKAILKIDKIEYKVTYIQGHLYLDHSDIDYYDLYRSLDLAKIASGYNNEAVKKSIDYYKDRSGFVIFDHVLYGYFGKSKTVTIPEDITSICRFTQPDLNDDYEVQVENVYVPKNVTDIERYAFTDESGLKKLILEDGVLRISDALFMSADEVVLPHSLVKITEDMDYQDTYDQIIKIYKKSEADEYFKKYKGHFKVELREEEPSNDDSSLG